MSESLFRNEKNKQKVANPRQTKEEMKTNEMDMPWYYCGCIKWKKKENNKNLYYFWTVCVMPFRELFGNQKKEENEREKYNLLLVQVWFIQFK
jgi:hypothetical protein